MTRNSTTGDGSGIETQQGCCGTESPGSAGVETEQGCCGTEPTDCGPETGDSSTDIETSQGCCGASTGESATSTEETDSGCGGDQERTRTSCCDGKADADSAESTVANGTSKSRAEHGSIKRAAEQTEELLDEMAESWTPTWTEREVYEFLQDRMDEVGVTPAWTRQYCPSVHAGADADVGHTLPGDRTVNHDELLHVDFGVSRAGYAADIQRVYYHPNETDTVPDDLQAAFDDVRRAIDAGLETLEPGVAGYEVDRAARRELTDRGWSEFNHPFGHPVGRSVHDDGTLLGPLWQRYGDSPHGEVTVGDVYSVELGVGTTYGFVGQEEMVRVLEDGYAFLVDPQTDIRLLPKET